MGVENRHISTLFHGNSQQVIDHLENTISFFEENELGYKSEDVTPNELDVFKNKIVFIT